MKGLSVRECARCGALHQHLEWAPERYMDYYRSTYHHGVYTHSYSQDFAAAQKRLDAYGAKVRGRVLDVGSGNGAFVDAARRRGLDAWGCEPAEGASIEEAFIYTGGLDELHFPTDEFDALTVHDVLEHIPDPPALLREAHRVLKQGGRLVLEVPDFHGPEGGRHWKAVEHVWLLRPEEFERLLRGAGFAFLCSEQPIPGKIVFHAIKPEERRPSILVPSGIGDIYWVMAKLKAFLGARGLGLPDVWVQDADDRRRSFEYVRRIPFVRAAGYRKAPFDIPEFREAYLQDARSVFQNVAGCDWFIGFNGGLRFGKSLDEIEPGYPADWFFPIFHELGEDAYGRACRRRFGPYAVAYFVPHGMYQSWLEQFPEERIFEALSRIAAESGLKFVFIGAAWDADGLAARLCARDGGRNFADLTGTTTFAQMMGLLRHCEGVVGFPAGNTILATRLMKPTVLLWSDYFCEAFHRNACPPQALGQWYLPVHTREPAEAVARAFAALLRGGKKEAA